MDNLPDTMPANASYRRLIEKSKSSVDSDSNWLITLSDLLSLLLVFFMMFFVMTKNTKRPGPVDPGKAQSLNNTAAMLPQPTDAVRERIKDEVTTKINNLSLSNDVSVQAVDKEIIITMKEKVSFSPGEAVILKRSETILDNIASIIEQYPAFLVEIEGHTDNVPIKTPLYPSNWELSVGRSTSVLKYFINRHGIDPSRLSIKGNADQHAIVPNDTPENRAQNRRVEIRLKEKEA
ncbi:MAG: OmpA family protein [Nitrospirae bacterium]|nr:OmpA family protein [Nitrospirota bacterium]